MNGNGIKNGIKMLNLSLNYLKLILKSTDIKGYKSMSEDRLLRALNAPESVKKIKRILLVQSQQELKIMMLIKY